MEEINVMIATHSAVRECSWITDNDDIDLLIVDESHKTKNIGSGINVALENFKCRKILISATPVMTRQHQDVFSTLRALAPGIYGELPLQKLSLEKAFKDPDITESLGQVCYHKKFTICTMQK